MTWKIRVLLADDHETVRQGLRLLIEDQSDMEVVGEAGDGDVALEQVKLLRPAVAVIDISMPGTNGLLAVRAIKAEVPATAIVVLTRFIDGAYVRELVAAHADAYVLKQSAAAELLHAIRATARGEHYFDARVIQHVSPPPIEPRSGRPGVLITERESAVLRLMALGHSNKEIAGALDVVVKTVEVHKANGMRKLGLGARIDVVRYAQLQGWLNDR